MSPSKIKVEIGNSQQIATIEAQLACLAMAKWCPKTKLKAKLKRCVN